MKPQQSAASNGSTTCAESSRTSACKSAPPRVSEVKDRERSPQREAPSPVKSDDHNARNAPRSSLNDAKDPDVMIGLLKAIEGIDEAIATILEQIPAARTRGSSPGEL